MTGLGDPSSGCAADDGLKAVRALDFEFAALSAGLNQLPHALDLRPLVNRQLDFIAALISELRNNDDDQIKSRLFRELCNRSVLHTVSRERVLVPAWRRVVWKEFSFATFRAHVHFKRRLANRVLHPPAALGHSKALSEFAAHVTVKGFLTTNASCLCCITRWTSRSGETCAMTWNCFSTLTRARAASAKHRIFAARICPRDADRPDLPRVSTRKRAGRSGLTDLFSAETARDSIFKTKPMSPMGGLQAFTAFVDSTCLLQFCLRDCN